MPEQKKKKSNGTRASSRSNSKSRAKTKQVKEQSSWEMSVSGIAAAVMVASALLFLLDIFGVDAVLIGAYANLMKGLLGVGYFVLPFCLLWCAWELVVTSDQHRRKSQWISLLLFPMLIGAWGHLFTVFQSAQCDYANAQELCHRSLGVAPALAQPEKIVGQNLQVCSFR